MKRLISVFVLLCLLSGSALAASVIYKGGAEKFVFLPGDGDSGANLFGNFEGVLPGDVLEQKITVKNDTDRRIRIYMRAENKGMEDADFLSRLEMTVKCRDRETFDAAPSETARLTENTLLGTFKSRGSAELTVTLTVPVELDHRYMGRVGVVPWTFLAEEISDAATPDTGDWFRTSVWISIAAVLAAAIALLLIVQRKRRTEN